MNGRVIPGIKPTRIELQKLRRRELLARRGHELLREKLEILVQEYSKKTEEYRQLRERVAIALARAHRALVEAEMAMGMDALRWIALEVPEMAPLRFSERRVLGTKVPTIALPAVLRGEGSPGYSLISTSAALDAAILVHEEAMREMVRLAELQGVLRRLAREIGQLRRRVKALENVLIPRLEATEAFIEMHLEELAREDFFRTKKSKTVRARGGEA